MTQLRNRASRPALRAALPLVALVFVAGCGGDPSRGAPAQRPPASVAVTEVRTADLADTVRGIGTLYAREEVEIKPEASGRIVALEFEEGTRVSAGQLLARLDDRKLGAELAARRAQLAQAEVRTANAERRLRRFERITDPAAVSRDDVDAARTELEAARAEERRLESEVIRAEELLADTRVVAPFGGTIGESSVDIGDYVEDGDTLATMHRVDMLELAFTLPERHRPRVKLGQAVAVEVAGFEGDPRFAGRVSYVDPAVDPSTRTFTVKAEIPNQNGLLVPGSFAHAELTLELLRERLVVPEAAVVATRSGYILFVVEEGIAHRREVRTGLRKPGIVEILSGVAAGETVIETGHMNVFEGAPVAVAGEGERPAS